MKKRTLIKNGKVLDGSGADYFIGDILIIGDKIEKVGKIDNVSDVHVIDTGGKIVTPGFIDIHRHCDYAMFNERFGEIELAQGITTAVTGSCGLTPFPFNKEYENGLNNLLEPCLGLRPKDIDFSSYESFDTAVRDIELPINIGSQIGSCAVRIAVKGFSSTELSKEEMLLVKEHIDNAMYSGAFGLSMGLMYTPEFYSTRDELISIAKIIAPYKSVLTTHIRGEGDSLVQSIKEVIDIAYAAGVKLEISHFKACGAENWGKSIHEAIEIIEKARAVGQDIGVDFYPYAGGSTTLLSMIPPSYMRESLDATWDFMASVEGVFSLEISLSRSYNNWDNYVEALGWERIIISSVSLEENKKFIGLNVSEITQRYGFKNECEFICKVLSEERGKVGIIVMSMSQTDIDTVAKLPYSTVISDSLYSLGANPHPRLYGSFGKIIRDFVKERGILTLHEAVRKMTYLPSQVMGINDRGMIREGFKADINIFEPAKFVDTASFDNPRVICSGMNHVIVNGNIAFKDGEIICVDAGERL